MTPDPATTNTATPNPVPTPPLHRGSVVWVDLDPTVGREQSGRRPALVVASEEYLRTVTTLVVVVPVTGVDRGWSNHVPLRGRHGLARPSWAMTEQPRTVSRTRVHDVAGLVDARTLTEVDGWLRDMLGL
ncbi:type II toxin-antitoxin system PemK/MazF family toxin [Sediminihabitans luteus]|uniref:type II toxin-antitoxin system PemK/MazF family toxin n=1 Tax=Sediminihabitans luteus TaxID=1138585 RepID=UPI001EF2487F|nr:type II toxin-antitoxin system PemK/MazF family toxin [Sediminihabitans luteus]